MKTLIVAAIRCALLFIVPSVTYAISAQWDLDPISGDWNTAANWTPDGVPNAPADTATFGLSNTTDVSLSANTEVNGITFTAAATNPYTITANPGFTLTISGVGIVNNSGVTQNFVTAAGNNYNYATIAFTNNASAGSSTHFTNTGANAPFSVGGVSGDTRFYNTSSAGNGTFTNSGATYLAGNGGFTTFVDNSTAANGIFINEGGTFTGFGIGSGGGATRFAGASTAANGTFTNNAATVSGSFGGSTEFYNTSTAGAATIVANGATITGAGGGRIIFADDSTGGTSRIEVFGNGNLDISRHNAPGVAIGSLEGDGNVLLGDNKLAVGTNNLSTNFSGVIRDGPVFFGDHGSLAKVGSGTLILSGANTYTGNTNVRGGVLQVDGSITSNTYVNAGGKLAGTGTVSRNVTNTTSGTVSPGHALGLLSVNGNYKQASYATLLISMAGTSTGQFSVLDVAGTANLLGAYDILNPLLLNGFVPAIGDSFTFLNYTSLNGTFFISDANIDNLNAHWELTYGPTSAILTVAQGNVPIIPIPDQGSTFLLLTLGLLGLVTYRRQLLRGQP